MPSIAEIAAGMGFDADGDLSITLSAAAHPKSAGAADLALAMDPKLVSAIQQGAARAAMLPPETDWRALGLEAAIFAPHARYALSHATRLFEQQPKIPAGRHPSAVIDPTAEIDPTAAIGPLTVIGARARIGAHVRLLGQTTIGADVEIGEASMIYPGARLGPHTKLGARCIVHENAVVGADGFSFVTPEHDAVASARAGSNGAVAHGAEIRGWARIASLGAVIIGDDVDIGAGSTLDRGTVVDTRIGDGVKIDNLVQIGHNVQIGDDCLLCGQVGVAGSAELGDRVVIGGKSGVADHAKLGDDVMLMAASGASGVVKPRTILGGTPAQPRDELGRLLLAMRRLPKLMSDVEALKKHFSSEKPSG